MPSALMPRERARLKARAHALEPLVQVGQAGLTETVVAEVDRALAAHELIKVRIAADRTTRAGLAEELAGRVDAALVSHVGKVVVLWRPKPEEALERTRRGVGS